MANKELNTRIALKYDSYANWNDESKEGCGANLVLLKGELGICYIGEANQDSNIVPTVLFKVGDGTKTFKKLPWASAKAADVYGWAKASKVILEDKTLKFVDTDDTAITSIEFDYASSDEVTSYVESIETRLDALEEGSSNIADRLTNIEAALGVEGEEGSNSVANQLDTITTRLDVIQGNEDQNGSIAAALKTAKAYADAQISDIESGVDQSITAEQQARITAINGLAERLTKVEVFFDNAAKDEFGEDGQKLTNALDTLVEIQNYLNNDGTAAGNLLTRISEIETRVQDVETSTESLSDQVAANATSISSISQTVESTNTSVTNLTNVVTNLADLVNDSSKGNEALLTELNKIAADVNNEATGLAAAYQLAEQALSAAEAVSNSGYLKETDEFIFQCGTASTILHQNSTST